MIAAAVSNLWIRADGAVFIHPQFRNDHIQVCNLNAEWKGVGTVTCLSWLSLMRSATARAGSSMLFYYSNSPAACSNMPTYESAPAPYYVMLQN